MPPGHFGLVSIYHPANEDIIVARLHYLDGFALQHLRRI